MYRWIVTLVILVAGCSEQEKSTEIDREALKAELRQEIVAELAQPSQARQPAMPTAEKAPPALGDRVEILAVEEPVSNPGQPQEAENQPEETQPTPPPAAPVVPASGAVAEEAKDELAAPQEVPASPAPVEVLPVEKAAPSVLSVIRLDIAAGVDRANKQPEGVATTFSLAQVSQLYAYVVVQNKGAETEVVAEWYRGSTRRSRMPLTVGHAIRGWRTWSKVRLASNDVGAWQVRVLDGQGMLLHTTSFQVVP
jgi:hypothetical protein